MNRWHFIGGGLLLAALILLGALFYIKANPAQTAETMVQAAVLERAEAAKNQTEQTSDTTSSGAETLAYASPVDFEALWEMNPDIYAWLYIPGTDINYPILQSNNGDDEFYLNHDSAGKSNKDGSIFTQQAYNKKDFSVQMR